MIIIHKQNFLPPHECRFVSVERGPRHYVCEIRPSVLFVMFIPFPYNYYYYYNNFPCSSLSLPPFFLCYECIFVFPRLTSVAASPFPVTFLVLSALTTDSACSSLLVVEGTACKLILFTFDQAAAL